MDRPEYGGIQQAHERRGLHRPRLQQFNDAAGIRRVMVKGLGPVFYEKGVGPAVKQRQNIAGRVSKKDGGNAGKGGHFRRPRHRSRASQGRAGRRHRQGRHDQPRPVRPAGDADRQGQHVSVYGAVAGERSGKL